MKKIRLMAIALLAGSMCLASCDNTNNQPTEEKIVDSVTSVSIVGVPGDRQLKVGATILLQADVQTTGTAEKNVYWETSNPDIATVSQDGVVTGIDEGTVKIKVKSLFNANKYAEVTLTVWCDPAIVSVEISGVPDNHEVVLHNTLQLTATVEKKGTATTKVNWKSSNTAIATVDNNGLVTTVAPGTFTITATSDFDKNKSATTQEITVVDKGFDPGFCDEGYSYSSDWSTVENELKEFLGVGEYSIVSFDSYVGGIYYQVINDSVDYFEIVVDGAREEEYYTLLEAAGFDRLYYNSDSIFECVDPTGTYTLTFYSEYDSDTGEYLAPTTFDFFRSADVWASSTLTTDTSWDTEKIDAESAQEYGEEISSVLDVLPFVAMGEEYEISWVVDYTILDFYLSILEAFGVIDDTTSEEEIAYYLASFGYTGPTEYLSIADYSIATGVFDNYGNALEQAGFTLIEEEDGSYYSMNSGFESLDVSYGFGPNGNEIIVSFGYANFDSFPTKQINGFIEDVLGSENKVVDLNIDGATYKGQISDDQDLGATLNLILNEGSIDEMLAYASLLEGEGFEVEYTPASDEDFPTWYATKGKLVIEFYIEQEESVLTGDFLDYGPVYFYIYADETKHEEQGIYLPETYTALIADGVFELPLEVVKLENPTFISESSNPEVATINGLEVTPIADGETTITISVAETSFTTTMVLTVTSKDKLDLIFEEVNAWLVTNDCSEVEFPDIPFNEVDGLLDDDYYEIMLDTTISIDDCVAMFEDIGFVTTTDEYGDPVCSNGEISINIWDYYGYMILDIMIGNQSSSTGATFDYSEITSTTCTIGDFTVEATKNGTEAAPAILNNSELRIYANNTLTISSETELITEIDFYTCDCTSKVGAQFEAQTGTLTETDYGYHWEGEAYEVVFTCTKIDDNHKQTHFFCIEVNGGGEGGGGGSSSDSDLEAICTEISYYLTGEETNYFVEDEGDYYFAIEWGTTDDYTLVSAVEEALEYLPEIFVYVDGDVVEDTWDDGDDGAFVTAFNEEETIFCDIGSYVYGTNVIVQFVVYEGSSF